MKSHEGPRYPWQRLAEVNIACQVVDAFHHVLARTHNGRITQLRL
jgi:hypothetical protein